jgi:polyribonucleotide nucleotidyltransferase
MIEFVQTSMGAQTLTIETGRVAKQASGAVTVRCGDTMILAAVVGSDSPREGIDFFPLSVDYRERAYAAGKIPGGFFKREGRPSEKEILSARLIDRPIRPLFPLGYKNEVQVSITVLSSDRENDADVLGLIGASAALAISPVPFLHTIAGVRVGRVEGNFILNPTFDEVEESDINLIVAGSADSITMVEGGTREVSEDDLTLALEFGHEAIRDICVKIDELKAKVGKPKLEVTPPEVDTALLARVHEMAAARIAEADRLTDKQTRSARVKEVRQEVTEALAEDFPEQGKAIGNIIHDIQAADIRMMILEEGKRLDGRGYDEIRDIHCEVGYLPRTHGSAIFTRGQTQALVVVTLGTKMDEQKLDELEGESWKSYMLHYNFPSYSVGEVRPFRGPGRREIGHGALAERAIQPMIPNEDLFSYTVRVVADVLESNGSSSMATVCGGSLALMDAGVPIKAPVAGIAMGMVMGDGKNAILTDILGDEDHYGDMDFKVTGTREGITAFQMDVKVEGLQIATMREALEKAKAARLHILDAMEQTIDKPREDLSPYAPRIITMKIKVSKIGAVIGPGGKVIRGIVERTGAKIDIEDDGTVLIASVDKEAGLAAQRIVESLVEEPEVGREYEGTVKRTAEFGAFVEILPDQDGLLHISEIDVERVQRTEDVLNVGDTVRVKVIEVSSDGKIRLSRRVLLDTYDPEVHGTPSSRPDSGGRGRGGGRDGGRDGGRGRRPDRRG